MIKKCALLILAICLVLCFAGCKPDPITVTSSTGQKVTVATAIGGTDQSETTGIPAVTGAAPGTTQAIAQTTQRQQVRVTIPEGWTFMQIANALEQKGVCSAADFYHTAQNYTVKSFSIPSSPDRCFKMEGYLYPDTYDFYTNDDPEDVLRKILNNYAEKSGLPSDDTLILASVIEKEVRSNNHMERVSAVFHNRLNQGMKLQSDATREYVNKYITGNVLVSDQSKYAPLYNTYKCAALPAGPICNPSARAIKAAQYYEASEYLYFFFGQDNDNHYSKTLEEHEQQIAQYGVG